MKTLTLLAAALLCTGVAAQTAPGAAAAAAPASAASAPPPSAEQVERRLAATATLIGQSSGARQIAASQHPDALTQQARARELHERARGAAGTGDTVQAMRLLDLAARAMMDAVRLAGSEQLQDRKDRGDFANRLESTRALLDAHKRIAAEKGAGPANAELSRRIEAMVAQAQRDADGGRIGEARRTLDEAYGATKAAIGGLRGGDTLVRSLNFASKQEEFAYEVDRNDTHRMLVTVLLRDRRGGPGGAAIDGALAEAQRLRREADAQGQRQEYDAGVRTLEESTRALVRAIRGAGIYIPG